MKPLRLLLSDSYDPWFNLAVEDCIFREMTTRGFYSSGVMPKR